ncbi:MAG: dihydrodipicolinate synthase family protein, partial [Candidatus Binatia bacterium]
MIRGVLLPIITPFDEKVRVDEQMMRQLVDFHIKAGVQGKLEQLRLASAADEARRPREDQAFASMQQLTAKLLGSANAGATGERIVEDALKALPPQWLLTDHMVANKKVEFAVRLPDGLI